MGVEYPDVEEWSRSVAGLSVDALIDAGLLRKEDLDVAAAVVAEEISVRLALGDYPPPPKSSD